MKKKFTRFADYSEQALTTAIQRNAAYCYTVEHQLRLRQQEFELSKPQDVIDADDEVQRLQDALTEAKRLQKKATTDWLAEDEAARDKKRLVETAEAKRAKYFERLATLLTTQRIREFADNENPSVSNVELGVVRHGEKAYKLMSHKMSWASRTFFVEDIESIIKLYVWLKRMGAADKVDYEVKVIPSVENGVTQAQLNNLFLTHVQTETFPLGVTAKGQTLYRRNRDDITPLYLVEDESVDPKNVHWSVVENLNPVEPDEDSEES